MGNCLVTKLKESVNNDNLIPIGYAQIDFNVGSSGILRCSIGNTMKCTVKGGTVNGQTTLEGYELNITNVVSDGTYDGIVKLVFEKYDLTYVNTSTMIDLSQFKYSHLNKLIVSGGVQGLNSISNLLEDMIIFQIQYNTVNSGDITELGKNGNLLWFDFVSTTALSGCLDNMGFSPISSDQYMSFPFTKNVTFHVEQFVANKRTAGMTTGSHNKFKYIGLCNATIFGDAVEAKDNYTLSWTADSITFDGVTYDNNGNII